MLLTDAAAIKVGGADAAAVYVGAEKVWPADTGGGGLPYTGTWTVTNDDGGNAGDARFGVLRTDRIRLNKTSRESDDVGALLTLGAWYTLTAVVDGSIVGSPQPAEYRDDHRDWVANLYVDNTWRYTFQANHLGKIVTLTIDTA